MVYKTLFNINLLHAYFLDRGKEKYHGSTNNDELSTQEKKKALFEYNLSDCLQIVPSNLTSQIIKNYRLLVRRHATGIRVLAQTSKVNITENQTTTERFTPLITLSEDTVLTFYVKVTDSYFENYTDIISKKSKQLYYLSNIPSSLSSSVTNIFDTNGSIERFQDFLLTDVETRKLVYEIEKENQFNRKTLKVVSTAAIKADEVDEMETNLLNPQTSLTEKQQAILEALQMSIQQLKSSKIIGIVQLKITGDGTVHFTEEKDNKQCLSENEIDFNIYIENKKTYWRYHKKSTNQIFTTQDTYPLTKHGKIEIGNTDVGIQNANYQFFPNPDIRSITEELQEYYSEIYI